MRRSAVVAAASETEHRHLAYGATGRLAWLKPVAGRQDAFPPQSQDGCVPLYTPSGLLSGGCGGPGGAECWLSPEAPFAFASAARLAAHRAFIAAAS
jgi:hypothetical protein